jgi:alkylation response protein AidB-like acyl-CoA dehydrogenase
VDVDLTPGQQALAHASRRLIERVWPSGQVRDALAHCVDFAGRRQAGDMGWFSLLVPGEQGGASVSANAVMDAALIAYQRGATLHPGSFVGTLIAVYAIAAEGTAHQRHAVLPGLMSGAESASWAVAEEAFERGGWLRQSAGPWAEFRDGHLVLHCAGQLAEAPEEPGWLLVSAATTAGPRQVLLRSDAPGVTVGPLQGLDLTHRFAEIRCDRVEIPVTDVVGPPDRPSGILDRQWATACVLTAAESVGAMEHVLALAVQYAKDRIAFGRPIGSFQAVKHFLADASLIAEMASSVVAAAAHSVGTWDGYGPQAASIAKAFVSERGVEAAQSCFQVFGGIGFTWEHDLHLYLRRLTVNAAIFGDAAWHRERLCQLAGI